MNAPLRLRRFAGAALAALLTVGAAGPTSAATPRVIRDTAFSVPTNSILEETHLVLAENADMAGHCNDDLFLLAQNFTLTGSCGNDLWAMGDQLSIGGQVADHARLAGNNIAISGGIANGLQAAGNTIHLDTGSVVRGGATLLADTATLSGSVEGGLYVLAGRCTLSGRVEGSPRIIANEIVVMPGTRITGDLHYTAPEELVLDPQVQLEGKLIRDPLTAAEEAPHLPWQAVVFTQVVFLIGALLSGILLMGLFPRFTGRAVLAIRQAPARCGLAGALGVAFLPMAALAAAITVIGLPVALLAAALFACLLYLGKIVVAVGLGALLLRWRGPQPFGRAVLALLLGLPVVYLVALVPGAGGPLGLLVNLLGLGALLQALWRPDGPVPPPVPR